MIEWIAIAVAIIATGLSAFAYYRSGRSLTVAGVQEAYVQSQTLAAELSEVANMAVAASAQLKESGKITTNEAAFNNAFDHINRWFPDLDRKIIANSVEGAYNLYKLSRTAVAALPDKPTQPEMPASRSPELGRMG